jgi:hypothetical protein
VYAQFKWNGDMIGPRARWHGVTRYIDTDWANTLKPGKTIKDISHGFGDWVPPTNSPDNPSFKAQPKVDAVRQTPPTVTPFTTKCIQVFFLWLHCPCFSA